MTYFLIELKSGGHGKVRRPRMKSGKGMSKMTDKGKKSQGSESKT